MHNYLNTHFINPLNNTPRGRVLLSYEGRKQRDECDAKMYGKGEMKSYARADILQELDYQLDNLTYDEQFDLIRDLIQTWVHHLDHTQPDCVAFNRPVNIAGLERLLEDVKQQVQLVHRLRDDGPAA